MLYNAPMDQSACDICGKAILANEHYVVRIDVFADPSMPATTSEALEKTNFDEAIANLLDQMKHLSEEDLQDQVHRRFEYRICRKCQPRFLANPLGKPRISEPAQN